MPSGRIPIQIIDGCLPCSKCRQTLPVGEFYAGDRATHKSIRACGYSSSCRKCARQYFADHPDKQIKQNAQSLAWQRAHPEQLKAIQRRYWAKCKLARIAKRLQGAALRAPGPGAGIALGNPTPNKQRCAPLQDMFGSGDDL